MLNANITVNSGQATVTVRSMGAKGDQGPEGPQGPAGTGGGSGALWGGVADDIDGINRPMLNVGPIDFVAEDGATVTFAMPDDNTGPVTIRVSSALGATMEANLVKGDGAPLNASDLLQNNIYTITYFNGAWQLQSPPQTQGLDVQLGNILQGNNGHLGRDHATDYDVIAGVGSTVSTIDVLPGRTVTLRFTVFCTLIDGNNLVLLNGGNDMSIEVGDIASFRGYPGGVTRMMSISRATP